MDLVLLERIFRLSRIPIRLFNLETEFLVFNRGYTAETDPLLTDPELRENILAHAKSRLIPVVMREEGGVIYGAYYANNNHCIFLGPVCEYQLDAHGVLFSSYAQMHKINDPHFKIKIRSCDSLCAALEWIYQVLTGQYATESEILLGEIDHQDIIRSLSPNRYMNDNTENDVTHNSYKEEREWMGMIAQGRPDKVKEGIEDYSALETIGRLAISPFKHYEYLCATTIALSTRSAIEGEMDSIEAYAMSDLLMQRLEKCTSIPEIIKLMKETRIGFAEKVKEAKTNKAQVSSIEKVKAYIDRHLTEPLTLDQLADVVQMNKTYLSHRFVQEEGIGIQKYIQQHRIELAAEILQLTDNSLIEIANYLCFPTQSYFGAVFKSYYGVTPLQYRERERKKDFQN